MIRSFTLLLLLCHPVFLSANDDLLPAFEAIEARDFDAAIESLEALPGNNRDVLFHLARVQYQDGRFDESAETLESLHKLFPADADAWYLEGLVRLAQVGEVSIFRKVGVAKKALGAWETAIEVDPGHINARYAIFAYYANAPGIAGGDLQRAGTLQREINEINAGFGAMAKALLLSKEDDPGAAEAAFHEAIELLDRAGPHFALAQFYMQTERFQEALVEIEQFLNKEKRWWDPDITVAHLIRARANAELGNVDSARTEAETALAMNPAPRIRDLLEETLDQLN